MGKDRNYIDKEEELTADEEASEDTLMQEEYQGGIGEGPEGEHCGGIEEGPEGEPTIEDAAPTQK